MRSILLVLTFFSGFFLRFFHLSSVPSILTENELTIGLWAYGFPAHTFNLNALAPLSAFSTIPFIKTFGLTSFAIRLPSFLLGFITILLFYFLAKEVFYFLQKKYGLEKYPPPILALVSTLFFALSPWHIQTSRADTPASLGLFLWLLGVFFLLKLWGKNNYVVLSCIPFLAAVYSDYNFFIPSLAIVLFLLCYSMVKRSTKYTLFFAIELGIFLILLLPVYSHIIPLLVHIEDSKGYLLIAKEQLSQNRILYSMNTPLSQLLYHTPIETIRLHIQTIFFYLEPQQLFSAWTKNPSIFSPFSGLFYPTDFLLFSIGILSLIKKGKRLLVFYLCWVAIIIVPLALVSYTPNPLAAITILPMSILIIAIGFFQVYYFSKKTPKKTAFFFLLACMIFFAIRFTITYFITYPKTTSDYALSYQQAFSYTKALTNPVVVIDATYHKNSYLYWLLVNKKTYIPPSAKNVMRQSSNYIFLKDAPSSFKRNVIYIAPTNIIPEHASLLYQNLMSNKQFEIGVFSIQ